MSRVLVLEGRRLALEAIRSGRALEVLLAAGARSTQGLRDVLSAAEAAAVPVREVPRDRIRSLATTDSHQGVVARAEAPAALGEADLERGEWAEDARIVVLDGVTDPHNVGAIARTAEAAGASALVLRRRRSAGLTPAALKSSAGALLHLPVAEVANISRALGRLKEAGFWVLGLTGEAETTIDGAAPPPGRLALVLGAEGEGLSRLVRESCDELVSIPLRGRVASLNVSAAAAVALFGLPTPGRR
ncbi:MAG TPA: 23S rRNA (guanosine(2251)-2'-O)-methyltransferase RlmB [Actinomycetota bacterium]